jgi:hypothetical protein
MRPPRRPVDSPGEPIGAVLVSFAGRAVLSVPPPLLRTARNPALWAIFCHIASITEM